MFCQQLVLKTMKSHSSVFFNLEYRALLFKQRSAVKEETLIVILGTLILGCWFLLGVISVETSSKFLRIFDPDIATTVIFLVVIPSSIFLILTRWISVVKTVSAITYDILCFQLEFAKEFADRPLLIKTNTELNNTKSVHKFVYSKLAKKILLAACFSFVLATVSGSVGFEKIEETNFLVFALSYIVFSVQISRILAIAVNLVTAIQKAM